MYYINMAQWPLYLGFTTSRKAFKAEMKRLKVKTSFLSRNTALATTHRLRKEGQALTVIIAALPFDKCKSTREQYAALIAHEALHVVQYLRELVNDDEPLGHETEAYLLQYIVQECLQEAWQTGMQLNTIPPS